MRASVDLFSGIGGFALSFHDLYKPILYCEKSLVAQKVLAENMHRGNLPKAEIINDVRDIESIVSAVGSIRVEMMTASSPCVGWSTVGQKQGLHNPETALFFDTLKVVKALNPAMLFFENVSQVLTSNGGKDFRKMLSSLSSLGYDDVRWTVCSARDVGAPQLRDRWFCLCIKHGFSPHTLNVSHTLPEWNDKMPKLVVNAVKLDSRRFSLLGNSVVPNAVRLAFARLYSGFAIYNYADLKSVNKLKFGHSVLNGIASKQSVKSNHGALQNGSNVVINRTNFGSEDEYQNNTTKILLDPRHYITTQAYTHAPHRVPLPELPSTMVIDKWPTPRAQAATHSHRLTRRTRKDLPTAVMYASKVNGKKMAVTKDGQGINPHFVEWLMGFPLDWTIYPST